MMNIPRLAVLAVVLHHQQVLLVRRRNEPDAGLWGYPGGHVEWGESCFNAAARELFEETSIIACPKEYLTNIDVISNNQDGTIAHHYLLAAVLCQYQSGEPFARDDIFEANWFSFNTVLNSDLQMSKDVDNVLQLAMHTTNAIRQ